MARARPSTVRQSDKLLEQFSPEIASVLIEFNKYISTLECDYIVFMARKSLRLYDFLTFSGGPLSDRVIMSDHILDQALDTFKGKHVALIDDTLILGTTIGEAKRKLEIAGAKVTCHVFSLDIENWCRDIVQPDYCGVALSHEAMLSFCAREVTALGSAGIPYLSDFPFSERVRLSLQRLTELQSIFGWETHQLSSKFQSEFGVTVYSVLPDPETQDLLRQLLGDNLFELVELAKIRIFTKRGRDTYWARFVPILTLRPMSQDSLEKVFSFIVALLEHESKSTLNELKKRILTPIGKLRFVQYVLSIMFGDLYLTSVGKVTSRQDRPKFDIGEAIRHFGPWLRTEFEAIHEFSYEAFKHRNNLDSVFLESVVEASLPPRVNEISKSEYKEFVRKAEGRAIGPTSARDLYVDLSRAFVELHRKYEIPAREEARQLGKRIFEVATGQAPLRDRLRFGFAWRALAECLLERAQLRVTLGRANLLSLLLDYLIDLGIAVPVLCLQDGVLFRGYRYGEDVPFDDQEFALAHETIAEYLEVSQRSSLQRLTLEKLLVALLRVGVAREFLRIQHGISGAEGIARIGFHLHGAVAMVPGHDTYFADEQDSWLSSYMVDRGIIRRLTNGGYELGERPEASFLKSVAVDEARQLGSLIGLLSSRRSSSNEPLLDSDDLVQITSCGKPRDVACAIAAELREFCRWFDRQFRHDAAKISWKNVDTVAELLQKFVSSHGFLAVHSGRRKLRGYWKGEPAEIIARCKTYLEGLDNGAFLARYWKSCWSTIVGPASQEETRQFGDWINRAARELLIAGMGISTIELAMASKIFHTSTNESEKRKYQEACAKVGSFLSDFSGKVTLSGKEQRLFDRLVSVANTAVPMENPEESLAFGSRWLHAHISGMRTTASQIDQISKDYGRLDRVTTFSFSVWYDVIDSKGDKSGLQGDALKAYRAKVRQFKESTSKILFGLKRDAARASAFLYSWQGSIPSTDDEKHIFISGAHGLTWVREVIKALLSNSETYKIRIRVIATMANFAVIPAHKYETALEVEGEAFWEHLSIVKKKVRFMEDQFPLNRIGTPAQRSSLWLCGKLIKRLDLTHTIQWTSKRRAKNLRTTSGEITIMLPVLGGPASLATIKT